MPPASSPQFDNCTDFLTFLGYGLEDHVEIAWTNHVGEDWHYETVATKDASARVQKSMLGNSVFFSTAVLRDKTHRKNINVIRIPILILDLDFKDAALGSQDNADKLLELIEVDFGKPDVLTLTGGGYQAFWRLADVSGYPLHEYKYARKAFGSYVKQVAEDNGLGTIDSTFDPARLLRVPLTGNFKYKPTPTVQIQSVETREPLNPEKVAAFCLEHVREPIRRGRGMSTSADSGDRSYEPLSDPDKWDWAPDDLCIGYLNFLKSAQALVEDYEKLGSRHNACLNSLFRIESHRRYGCWTEDDYREALSNVRAKFEYLLATQEPKREPGELEFEKLQAYVLENVADMTQDELLQHGDLRGHPKEHRKNKSRTKVNEPAFDLGERKFPGRLVKAEKKMIHVKTFHEDPITKEPILYSIGHTPYAGVGAIGKSTVACWYACQISVGTLPGMYLGTPSKVVIFTTEDDWNRVWVPKIVAMNGDLDKFLIYEPEIMNGNKVRFNLLQYGPYIGEIMDSEKAVFGLIEAAHRYAIPAGSTAEVGNIIEDLNDPLMASDMFLMSLLPTVKDKVKYGEVEGLVMGDQGWVLASRQVQMAMPEDEDKGKSPEAMRLSATVKSNQGNPLGMRHFNFNKKQVHLDGVSTDSVELVWRRELDTGLEAQEAHSKKIRSSKATYSSQVQMDSTGEPEPLDENGRPLTKTARRNLQVQKEVEDILEGFYVAKDKANWPKIEIDVEEFFKQLNAIIDDDLEATQTDKRRFERFYNRPSGVMPLEWIKGTQRLKATKAFLIVRST